MLLEAMLFTKPFVANIANPHSKVRIVLAVINRIFVSWQFAPIRYRTNVITTSLPHQHPIMDFAAAMDIFTVLKHCLSATK